MTTAVPLIYSFPELSGVAEAVADLVAATQEKVLNKKDTIPTPRRQRRFRIAISGGSLLTVLQHGLLNRKDIRWDLWDVYFADERLVPFSSPESNYGQACSKLFSQLPTKPNIYPISEKLIDDPQECADDYEKTLISGFASKDSVKLPCFDLILLGCAPDGHTASLFPNHETLREMHAWCVPVENAPSGPSNRISLSVPVICHAHNIAFVVEGATKAPVLRTIMERPDKGLPASIINEQAAGKVAWFVDDDAISDVQGITKKRYKWQATNV
ncbi:hypothetical protein CANINC_003556 [Pichia inconspicua]|uniref:6-phosphogluconolactonase-like protein n=1 Tax=Pichia inconspicua TaxID=52247 RepID=A0A4V4NFE6_9ASCO|nr:hypothetical protein CANINC_003556 [[Candida] inconspicua]